MRDFEWTSQGLGEKVGSRLLLAADTASSEYTFGYGAGATSIKERYSTDEVRVLFGHLKAQVRFRLNAFMLHAVALLDAQ